MTETELTEYRALANEGLAICERCPEPPWEFCKGSHQDSCICGLIWSRPLDRVVVTVPVTRCPVEDHAAHAGPDEISKAILNHIADARTREPALCTAVLALTAEVERLRAERFCECGALLTRGQCAGSCDRDE